MALFGCCSRENNHHCVSSVPRVQCPNDWLHMVPVFRPLCNAQHLFWLVLTNWDTPRFTMTWLLVHAFTLHTHVSLTSTSHFEVFNCLSVGEKRTAVVQCSWKWCLVQLNLHLVENAFLCSLDSEGTSVSVVSSTIPCDTAWFHMYKWHAWSVLCWKFCFHQGSARCYRYLVPKTSIYCVVIRHICGGKEMAEKILRISASLLLHQTETLVWGITSAICTFWASSTV